MICESLPLSVGSSDPWWLTAVVHSILKYSRGLLQWDRLAAAIGNFRGINIRDFF